jgi:hypothetical protein
MLIACRLAGLSALKPYYARVRVGAQFRPTQRSSGHSGQSWKCRSSGKARAKSRDSSSQPCLVAFRTSKTPVLRVYREAEPDEAKSRDD